MTPESVCKRIRMILADRPDIEVKIDQDCVRLSIFRKQYFSSCIIAPFEFEQAHDARHCVMSHVARLERQLKHSEGQESRR